MLWRIVTLSNMARVATIFAALFTIVAVLFALQFLTSEGTHDLKQHSSAPQVKVQEVRWHDDVEESLESRLVADFNTQRYEFNAAETERIDRVLTRLGCLSIEAQKVENDDGTITIRTIPSSVLDPYEALPPDSLAECQTMIPSAMWTKLDAAFPGGIQRSAAAIALQAIGKTAKYEEAIDARASFDMAAEASIIVWNEGKAIAEAVSLKTSEQCPVELAFDPPFDTRRDVPRSTTFERPIIFTFAYATTLDSSTSLDAVENLKQAIRCMGDIEIEAPVRTRQQIFIFPPWVAIGITAVFALVVTGVGLYASERNRPPSPSVPS